MKFYLVIDQGTHASRAIIFDSMGNIKANASQPVSLLFPGNSFIEQDASNLLASINRCVDEALLCDASFRVQDILSCALITQRSTVVAWDKETGHALSPAISWQDVRAQRRIDQLSSEESRIHEISGLPLSAHYGASKIAWLLSHSEPINSALQSSKLRIGPLSSFLCTNLIATAPDICDVSNAQRTQLMNIRTLKWSPELCDTFAVPTNILPQLCESQSRFGVLGHSSIPLKLILGDQNAAVLGNGPLDEETAWINAGTGAFIIASTDISSSQPGQLITSIGAQNCQSRSAYLLEGTVNGAGAAIQWYQNTFPDATTTDMLPASWQTIKNIPLFINSIGGIGSPWWCGNTPPGFINDTYDPVSRLIGVIESICFLLQHNLAIMQQQSTIRRLSISGGLSNIDGFCQILSDLSGLPVSRQPVFEASARGAAWLLAGEPDNWQLHPQKIFYPCTNTPLAQRFQTFTDMIGNLKSDQAS